MTGEPVHRGLRPQSKVESPKSKVGRARVGFRTACVILALLCLAARAHATDVQLWPLFRYHSDASGQRSLGLLGPLFSYSSGPDGSEVTLRPLWSYTRGPRATDREFVLLYPVWVSRWNDAEVTHRVLGLISYRSQDARRPDEWDRQFTIFPVVFYRYSRSLGTWLSVLPFYANLRDVFGYERIQMVLFPFYLHLRQPLVERTWAPFPFVGWSGGTLGRGYRLWPFYGWQQLGEQERFRYVMWPFYISHERNFTRPERERRLLVAPFYSRIESPSLDSRSYAGPFLTRTIDRRQDTDTWGFPWPLWVSQRRLSTGERTGLRLAPFYEDTHFGDVHAHFVMWPLYRWHTQDVFDPATGAPTYQYQRSDVLLALYRSVDESQIQYHRRRRLRTVFPLFRASRDAGDRELSTLAVLDALYPWNPTIKRLYAPLWQVFTRTCPAEQAPRWSLLWDLVSSDGGQLRYPVQLSFTQ